MLHPCHSVSCSRLPLPVFLAAVKSATMTCNPAQPWHAPSQHIMVFVGNLVGPSSRMDSEKAGEQWPFISMVAA